MAARSGRGIRGRGDDLRAAPGDDMLERLVGPAHGTKGSKATKPQRDMSTNPHVSEAAKAGGERVKVSFYLGPEQRDELEKSLVDVRRLVEKVEGRRLDQSALVRVVLAAVMDDFRQHAMPESSLLVKWLRAHS